MQQEKGTKLDFIPKAAKVLMEYLQQTVSGKAPCTNFKLPQDIIKHCDFGTPDQAESDEKIINDIKAAMALQVRPYHPHFHNQLFIGFNQYAVSGDILTSGMNGSMYTYQMAPCFTLMEVELFKRLQAYLKWENIDGVMTPGGSFANFYAMVLARHNKFPQVKEKGVQGYPPMKIFTSGHSHYSISKAAITLGLGLNSIVKVPTDKSARIIPQELDRLIQESLDRGEVPFMVNATVGTTVVGAIDPIEPIAKVCQKYKIWLHADAALAGPAFFDTSIHEKVAGHEMIDSITWDPHKTLQVPLQCSVFITKHIGVMAASNSMSAPYLFHKDRTNYSPTLDTGDKTLQCGRHIDVFKLWVYIKSRGWKQLEKDTNKSLANAKALEKKLMEEGEKQGKWIMCYPVQTFNVCFYYVPKAIRDMKRETPEQKEKFYEILGKVMLDIKKKQMEEGKMMIGYAKTQDYKDAFMRQVAANPQNSMEDLCYELDLVEKYGEEAYAELKTQ